MSAFTLAELAKALNSDRTALSNSNQLHLCTIHCASFALTFSEKNGLNAVFEHTETNGVVGTKADQSKK